VELKESRVLLNHKASAYVLELTMAWKSTCIQCGLSAKDDAIVFIHLQTRVQMVESHIINISLNVLTCSISMSIPT
jgi:hypothetical protein